ncbi:hypothetical protein QE152_g38216 [Popillia japonica]|uniref:Transposase n=1 Tax=Popillia japonica TaxID=7064 RepID=A0AAW1I8G5_POPJA
MRWQVMSKSSWWTFSRRPKFSIQLDESTLSDNTARLMSYVRYFNETGETKEEMLFAEFLPLDTTGTSIFVAVKKYFEEKEIPLINIHSCATDGAPAMVGRYKGFLALLKKEHPEINIHSCATDGAPAMVGRYKGFLALLKKEHPDIICIHCVAHREHLAAKRLTSSLHDSLNLVITAVNVIKTNAKSDRLFRNLCQENDEIYNRLLLHTEVRWLSKGNCLLRKELYQFPEINQMTETPTDEDLLLYGAHLQQLKEDFTEINQMTETPTDEDLLLYGAHLQQLKEDFTSRFQDLIELDVPAWITDPFGVVLEDVDVKLQDLIELDVPAWITDPFGVVLEDVDVKLQEELVKLRNNEDCKVRNKTGIKNLWQNHSMAGLFPTKWEIVHKLLLTFPTSYLVETGFSAATFLHSDKRNRLDMVNREDLRLYLTLLTPRVKKLVSKYQPQGSH